MKIMVGPNIVSVGVNWRSNKIYSSMRLSFGDMPKRKMSQTKGDKRE